VLYFKLITASIIVLAVFIFAYKAGQKDVLADWNKANAALDDVVAERVAVATAAQDEYLDALEVVKNVKPENNGDVAPVLRDAINRLRRNP
jgi:uncharacterized membrane protein